jgi:hypothetical protein
MPPWAARPGGPPREYGEVVRMGHTDARLRRRVDHQGTARVDSECAHRSRTGHKSRPIMLKKLACGRSPVTARVGLLATTGSAMDGLGWPMAKRRTRVRTIGPLQHFTLERETDIMRTCMRTIALRISPRDAEVPSSTQSAYEMHRCRVAHNLPRLSPVGTNRDAHRIGSRFPLLAHERLDRCNRAVLCIPFLTKRTHNCRLI